MTWYKWNSKADFDLWHDKAKTALGLPKHGVGMNGGPQKDSPLIEDYVVPVEVAIDDWRANIEPEVVALNLEGLGIESVAPPAASMEDFFNNM